MTQLDSADLSLITTRQRQAPGGGARRQRRSTSCIACSLAARSSGTAARAALPPLPPACCCCCCRRCSADWGSRATAASGSASAGRRCGAGADGCVAAATAPVASGPRFESTSGAVGGNAAGATGQLCCNPRFCASGGGAGADCTVSSASASLQVPKSSVQLLAAAAGCTQGGGGCCHSEVRPCCHTEVRPSICRHACCRSSFPDATVQRLWMEHSGTPAVSRPNAVASQSCRLQNAKSPGWGPRPLQPRWEPLARQQQAPAAPPYSAEPALAQVLPRLSAQGPRPAAAGPATLL